MPNPEGLLNLNIVPYRISVLLLFIMEIRQSHSHMFLIEFIIGNKSQLHLRSISSHLRACLSAREHLPVGPALPIVDPVTKFLGVIGS